MKRVNYYLSTCRALLFELDPLSDPKLAVQRLNRCKILIDKAKNRLTLLSSGLNGLPEYEKAYNLLHITERKFLLADKELKAVIYSNGLRYTTEKAIARAIEAGHKAGEGLISDQEALNEQYRAFLINRIR